MLLGAGDDRPEKLHLRGKYSLPQNVKIINADSYVLISLNGISAVERNSAWYNNCREKFEGVYSLGRKYFNYGFW